MASNISHLFQQRERGAAGFPQQTPLTALLFYITSKCQALSCCLLTSAAYHFFCHWSSCLQHCGNGLHYHQQVRHPSKTERRPTELPDPWKNSMDHLNNLKPPSPKGPIFQGLCQGDGLPPTKKTATMSMRCEATGVSEWEPKFLPPLSHEI